MSQPGSLYIFWHAFTRRWTTPVGLGIFMAGSFSGLFGLLPFPRRPLAIVARPLLWPGQPRPSLGLGCLGRDVLAGIFTARVFVRRHGRDAGGRGDRRAHGLHGRLLRRQDRRFAHAADGTLPDDPSVPLRAGHRRHPAAFDQYHRHCPGGHLVAAGPRLVRGEFIALRDREFVQACHSVGMSNLRIVFTEILPNAMTPVIVTASIMVATAIFAESSLAFLGLGDPNVMSWGNIIAGGREMLRSAWYIRRFPGYRLS